MRFLCGYKRQKLLWRAKDLKRGGGVDGDTLLNKVTERDRREEMKIR